jgi:hypothetical protein
MSGEPYISHPLAVAQNLASWHLDANALMAALLHDVMEDTAITKEQIAARFGKVAAELVDGVSKLDRIEHQSFEEAQAENFRKMLLAMARDVRVILIKLSDRLHNMQTLDACAPRSAAASPAKPRHLRADRQPPGPERAVSRAAGTGLQPCPSAAPPRAGQGGQAGARQSARSGRPHPRRDSQGLARGRH